MNRRVLCTVWTSMRGGQRMRQKNITQRLLCFGIYFLFLFVSLFFSFSFLLILILSREEEEEEKLIWIWFPLKVKSRYTEPWAPIKRHAKKANCLVFFLFYVTSFWSFQGSFVSFIFAEPANMKRGRPALNINTTRRRRRRLRWCFWGAVGG